VSILEIIELKKQGSELTEAQLAFVVEGFTSQNIPEYQMAAFLMAVWFRGLTAAETALLTGIMLRSGEQLDTSELGGPAADKHSTGGVGDKVSLLLAPLAAACGLKVPMLSGRGLGHTGGTLDKLEAIPGYNIHLSNARFLELVAEVGCAIVGQSGSIAPADGRIYALRDVTGTVDCIPLITASIMSKKLAAGPQTIVIDLKTGSGAFMADITQARDLARALVDVGQTYGRRMSVVFSDMGQPLGQAIGHANETVEAFDALRPGNRVTAPQDLVSLTEELVAEMVAVAGVRDSRQEALALVREVWDTGVAWQVMLDWVRSQGGKLIPDREDFGLTIAPVALVVKAPCTGWLAAVDCREVGLSLADLGAARQRVQDPLDLSAGVVFHPSVGDHLIEGDPVATIHVADERLAAAAASRILSALSWSSQSVEARDVVLGRLSD